MNDTDNLLALLKPGTVVQGVVFPEPVEIVSDPKQRGAFYKLEGRGMTSGKFYNPNLSLDQLAQLTVTPLHPPYDGDAHRFKLGIEAARLGLALPPMRGCARPTIPPVSIATDHMPKIVKKRSG